jgi:hypothetical protein
MTRSCRRYRSALAALAERTDLTVLTPDGRAALEHVDGCPACATTLGELMLTATALRRIGADAAAASGRSDDAAWRRLRPKLERSRERPRDQSWRGRSTLNGLALSMLLVVILVGPAALRFRADAASGAASDASAATTIESVAAERNIDVRNPPSPEGPRSGTQIKRSYPDGTRPDGKEVSSARSNVRPAQPR